MQTSQQAECPQCHALLTDAHCGGLCHRCIAQGIIQPDDQDGGPFSSGAPVRFDDLAPLAFGGMGAVYEAFDRKLARAVALKFLHTDLLSNPAARLRFELETLIASQLEHPAVIPIYDVGQDLDGRPFYVMRRVSGGTLSTLLEELLQEKPEAIARGSLSQLLTAFQKVCDAVAYAHSRRIIHRDLKPANVMLGQFGEVFVMDWGLAKPLPGFSGLDRLVEGEAFFSEMASCERSANRLAAVCPETHPNALLGTPGFMAPEQADANAHLADERTDIYGLGAILYNILTLHPPVFGDEQNTILQKTASGQIVHPSVYERRRWFKRLYPLPHCPGGRIPPALASITMKALAKLPDHRYQRVEELQKDLADWLALPRFRR